LVSTPAAVVRPLPAQLQALVERFISQCNGDLRWPWRRCAAPFSSLLQLSSDANPGPLSILAGTLDRCAGRECTRSRSTTCLVDARVLSWSSRCWCEQEHLKYLQHRASRRSSAALVALSASGELEWHGTPLPPGQPSRACVRPACAAWAAPISPAYAHGTRASATLCNALVVCDDSCDPLFAGSRHATRTSRPTLPEAS
jgi:hypothetical protein